MVKKKLLVSLLGAAMVASLVSGCGGGKKSGKKTVGIAMPTKTLERWNRDGSYLEKQFKDKGYDVSLKFSDNKIDQQVKDIEGLIADDVDLLVIAAIDGESLTKVLDDAKEEDIPVISYDRLIKNTEAVSYYVSFDNYRVGQLQGEFVRDKLDLDNAAGHSILNLQLVILLITMLVSSSMVLLIHLNHTLIVVS